MKRILLVLCLFSATIQIADAQGLLDAGVMEIQPSADANGMAGIAASLPSDNATATIANPAQLGLFSLTGFLNTSIYVEKTPWLPNISWTSDHSLNTSAANIGMNLGNFLKLPLQCSLGAGYSRVFLDQGTVEWTTAQMDTSGFFHLSERQEDYAIGVGFDWFVKLGLGYTFKSVALEEAGLDSTGNQLSPKANAHDYGIMAQIPVVEIASHLADQPIILSPDMSPIFNINIGYARRNIGEYVSYPPSPLLPRTATLGLNFEIGIKTDIKNRNWNLFSFIWAREAEDLLAAAKLIAITPVSNNGYGYSYENFYKSGIGDIEPIDNLILGRTYGKVALRKGWQVQLAEFLYVRGGSFEGVEFPFGVTYQGIGYSYSTLGTSVKLSGLLKLLAAFDIVDIEDGPLAFLADHLDLQYHFSEYTNGVNTGADGTTFKEINLVIK
ncbi:MAG TPA: hypothetical protein VLX91_06340 [Candidatus Acidoferrales bacterium]|nr:hypothetical protein [Candidatus Acidoferrales bacterium]